MDITTNLTSQIKDDYLAYSMAVLVGRAIPSLTDGMKPVQRRILAAMRSLGLKPDGRYMKSARVEGEVMGKYHPHGSSYGAMVTLAAPWNNNLPLIDGHGNWGSSVDPAASSRYTECKLSSFSWDCLLDDSETWQTSANYDNTLQEPVELNVKIPAVLLNGQEGIGVGFATKIPPHNLRDICDAVTKDTQLTPSFPTQCQIIDDEGLRNYVETGSGTLRLRAIMAPPEEEKTRGKVRTTLRFTNLPPTTNPEKLGLQIKEGLEKGKLEGITAVTDESDRTGDCLAILAKPGTDIALLTKRLYAYTDLESTFSAKLLVIDGTKPVELSPRQLISRWKTWRLDRLGIKFSHEEELKMVRLEIVMGLLKAIDKIDAVIAVIRAASSPKEALIELVSNRNLKFTSDQARAILEMKLRSLTNLDSSELATEKQELETRLAQLKSLISDEKARSKYMIAEIKAIGARHGEASRSQLIDPPESLSIEKGSARVASPVSKPRFLKVDMKRGVVEQAKGPRGALILETSDKLICLTDDGMLRKLPATFKGTLSSSYVNVLLAKKERDVAERKYLCVFTLNENLQALSISGEDLCRTTSTGKRFIPETATLVHFGEGPYKVLWVSTRKKTIELSPLTVKMGKPGAKGIKVAHMEEVTL
jgi:DNA gyrase subunit A